MPIRFRAATDATGSTITPPTGAARSDLLLACAIGDLGAATTLTWPAGWTVVTNRQDSNFGVWLTMEVAWCIYDGVTSSWSVTNATGIAVSAYSGASPTTPLVGGSISLDAKSNNQVATPTINNISGGIWRVCAFAYSSGNGRTWNSYSPADIERTEIDWTPGFARFGGIALTDSGGPIAPGNTSVTATASGVTTNSAGWIGFLLPRMPRNQLSTAVSRSNSY